MIELQWQDPPSRRADHAQYDPIIETLQQHPGRWALVVKDWKTTAGPSAFKQRGCEMTTRRNSDKKTWSVYVRWPLPKGKAAAQVTPAPDTSEKAAIAKAVATGTALKPPPPVLPRRKALAEPAPPNDFGLAKFRADRAARGVPAEGSH